MTDYRHCANPTCRRKLAGSAAYCCGNCANADRDKWDIDGEHTESCDSRAAEREDWKP